MAVSGGSSGGGSSGAVRAGGAFVEIFAKDAMLRKGLDGAAKRLQAFGSTLSGIGTKLGVAGALITTPFLAFFKAGIDRAAGLDDLADAFGTTTESLSPLAHAFGVAGLGLNDLEMAMKKAAEAGGEGKVEDKLLAMVKAGEELEDPMERAAYYFEKFGKAGGKVAAIAVQLDGLLADAPITTSEMAANAERAQMAFNSMKLSFQGALLPGVMWLAQYAQQLAEFAQRMPGLIQSVAGIAGAVIAGGSALKFLGESFEWVGFGVSMLSSGFGLIAGAFAFVMNPIGLLVTAIGGLTAVWLTMTDSGKAAVNALGDALGGIADTGSTAFGGMIEALQDGDLETAFEFATEGLEIMWLKTMRLLESTWDKFKAKLATGFEEERGEIGKAVVDKMNKAFEVSPKPEGEKQEPPKEQFKIAGESARIRLSWNGKPLGEALGIDPADQKVRVATVNKPAPLSGESAFQNWWDAMKTEGLGMGRIGGIFGSLEETIKEEAEDDIQRRDRLQKEKVAAYRVWRNRKGLMGGFWDFFPDAEPAAAGGGGKVGNALGLIGEATAELGEAANLQAKGMFGSMGIANALGFADANKDMGKKLDKIGNGVGAVGNKLDVVNKQFEELLGKEFVGPVWQ